MIEGSGSERRLAEITHGTADGTATIWTPNALAPYWKPRARFEGDLGRVYGVQWRRWRTPVEHKAETFKDDFGNTYNRQGLLNIKVLRHNYMRRFRLVPNRHTACLG
jgi:hypothetical protein